MDLDLEHHDVQWMLVSRAKAPRLFQDASRRARELQQTFEFNVTDGLDTDLTDASSWSQTTYGSGTLSAPEGLRRFIWNTFSSAKPTRLLGGLYIEEFTSDSDLLSGYANALETLGALFWGEQTLCLVLALENDFGIDLAPGISGRYQHELWDAVRLEPEQLSCLEVNRFDRWVEAMPRELKAAPMQSVSSMAVETQRTLIALENQFGALLAGDSGD